MQKLIFEYLFSANFKLFSFSTLIDKRTLILREGPRKLGNIVALNVSPFVSKRNICCRLGPSRSFDSQEI